MQEKDKSVLYPLTNPTHAPRAGYYSLLPSIKTKRHTLQWWAFEKEFNEVHLFINLLPLVTGYPPRKKHKLNYIYSIRGVQNPQL